MDVNERGFILRCVPKILHYTTFFSYFHLLSHIFHQKTLSFGTKKRRRKYHIAAKTFFLFSKRVCHAGWMEGEKERKWKKRIKFFRNFTKLKTFINFFFNLFSIKQFF